MEILVQARDIAQFLGLPLHGRDIAISMARSLERIAPQSLVFAMKYSLDIREKLNATKESLAIVIPDYSGELECSYLVAENPRLEFARTLERFFVQKTEPRIAQSAKVSPTATIGKDVAIGEYSIIEDGVVIGDRTEILHHVVIHRDVVIGRDCLIASHCTIGAESLSYAFDKEERPIRFPQLGGVDIGNHVYIGVSTFVARGALDKTVIGNYVKIGNFCNIGHNVFIDQNSLIISGALLGGQAKIGKNAYIAPNATLRECIQVGQGAKIGLGAAVIKDVGAGVLVVGNPARPVPGQK